MSVWQRESESAEVNRHMHRRSTRRQASSRSQQQKRVGGDTKPHEAGREGCAAQRRATHASVQTTTSALDEQPSAPMHASQWRAHSLHRKCASPAKCERAPAMPHAAARPPRHCENYEV
jgi:hypothetical protein